MTQAIKGLAEKRRKWVEANRENGFEAGIKRLLTDLYPDSAHFIYELLQNAEDAHAQEVRFILHEDRIEFEHNGKRLFSIKDVDAITSIGFSTKRDDTTNIGKFGVGFKAVFAYTNSPEIKSGEFHIQIRDMVVPEQVSKRVVSIKQTQFILPFNNQKKPQERARKEIETLLRTLDATTLLFLTRIRKVEYLLPDSSLGYVERIKLGDNRFEIRVQQPNEFVPSSSWFLKFDKEVQVEDEEAENEIQKVKNCRIAVAFGLSPVESNASTKEKKGGGADATPKWELVPMEPGRVCIYFPADKETSNLRFHLHAPFASTVARDSVRDCAGNNTVREHLAELLAESMHAIRDQGLLTVRALALLPNDRDNLTEFYQPLIFRLVEEFRKQDLVPMKGGGHASASGIFRGPKALSDLISDDDLVTLLGVDYYPPIWAANPSQRNQREDNFLSMLNIEQWNTAELVKALGKMNKDARAEWMGSKDDKWHQNIYEVLMDHLNTTPKYPQNEVINRKESITQLNLIRCSDGVYRKGNNSFFPTEEVEQDDKFPRVAKGVYISGKEQNKKISQFLSEVGVREVDEQVEIEALLKTQYGQDSNRPNRKDHYSHLRRFIRFLDENPARTTLFQEAFLFMIDVEKNVEWMTPTGVYLDAPFIDTGLRFYYEAVEAEGRERSLSSVYEGSGIKLEIIGQFAQSVGAKVVLNKQDLISIPPRIIKASPESRLNLSRVLWTSMAALGRRDCKILQDSYNYHKGWGHYGTKYYPSTLCKELLQAEWVPQKHGKKIDFVQPRDAVAEKLSEGFEYQTGWQWLRDIDFGKGVEERRETQRQGQERQTAAYKRKEEVVRDMGFESPEEAEEIAQWKKENPEDFRKLKENISACKEHSTFPTSPVANPERRRERLREQLSNAPDKEYEIRERSVRTTNDAIDPATWLRNQYKNKADQMVCQICQKEMPFRKRNREHYFEAVEAFSKDYFSREHEAQFLALCPLCAAMYKEFVKPDKRSMEELRNALRSSDEPEVSLTLGELETSIRFVRSHFIDIKTILGAEE